MKLDLGCGTAKKEGFIGVDSLPLKGVDVVHDLTTRWPWQDETVDEVHCAHFLEHLTQEQRSFFANELYRVLKKGGRAYIKTPDAGAFGRAYGDPTHKWPPIAPMTYAYWNRDWRMKEAPHVDAVNMPGGLACDFDFGVGYGIPPEFAVKTPEVQQFAVAHYLEARGDLEATLTKTR